MIKINKHGLCYACDKPIEKGAQYYRYKSMTNGSISNFHEDCWVSLPVVAGSATPQLLIMGGEGERRG